MTNGRQLRQLVWDGCINFRDLGGHPTEDGRETRFGRIVRADSVRRLTDQGWRALLEYGVGRIVDLRWDEELEADPPLELRVQVAHIPLFGSRRDMDEINEIVAELDSPVASRRVTYLECLDRFGAGFAGAVEAVAACNDRAVVVHCAGGVDRTGLVVALLLRLAGVAPAEIAADYALSEQNWAPFTEEWIAAAESEKERRMRRLLAPVPAQVMLETLETLEATHGDVRGYLRSVGASEEALDRVHARLRD